MAEKFKALGTNEKRATALSTLASNGKEKDAVELLRSIKLDDRCDTVALIEIAISQMKIVMVTCPIACIDHPSLQFDDSFA